MLRPLDEAALAEALRGRRGRRASRASRSPSCTPTSTRRTSARAGELARAAGFAFVALSSRGLAPAPLRPARRDHGRRRLPDAGAARLRRSGWRRTLARRAAVLHDLGRRRWCGRTPSAAATRVVSGPAGGVVGVARTSPRRSAARPCSASTWAAPRPTSAATPARWSGATRPRWPACKLRAPMLDVETVAAGGGSILAFDGLRARVGPASAGADPGPAAYGRGGPATVTDANLVLGRLDPAPVPGGVRAARRRAAGRRPPPAPRLAELAARDGRAERRGGGARASSPSRSSRRPARSAASPPSAASIRATTPWSPSAARPARSPARSPRRSASARCCRPRYASVLSAWGIGQARMRGRSARPGSERPLDAGGLGDGRGAGRAPASAGARPNSPPRAPQADEVERAASICATPKPTPRCPSRSATLDSASAPASRPRTGACSASSSRTSAILIASVEVEAVEAKHAADPRGGRRPSGSAAPSANAGRCSADALPAPLEGPAADRARRHPDLRSRPAGAPIAEADGLIRLVRVGSGAARQRPTADEPRPGHPGALQPPLHGRRRGDGRGAGAHRALGEHQGAAGLLLRPLRRRRRPGRQRAAHAGAPGLDGRQRAGGARAPSECSRPARPSRSTTPTPAAPTCRTSPWSCRCSPTASRARLLRRRARPPRRRRRRSARLDAAVLAHDRRGGRAAGRPADHARRRASWRPRPARR